MTDFIFKVPMLCGEAKESDLDNPNYWAEEKYDGTRIVVAVQKGLPVRIFSRAGIEYTAKYPELCAEFEGKLGLWDGELVFYKDGKVEFFTVAATEEVKKTMEWKFVVFDNLEWQGTYGARRSLLEVMFKDSGMKRVMLSRCVKTNKRAFWEEVKARNDEGLVLKRIDSVYQPGARGKDWMKLKFEQTYDLTVIGWVPGEGKRKAFFGALLVIDEEGRTANVGGGFTDSLLAEICNERLLPDGKLKERFVIEVRALNQTKLSYRMPRFVRFRDDKKPIKEVR